MSENQTPLADDRTKAGPARAAAPGTVVVACKLPNGVELQMCEKEECVEDVRGERKHFDRYTKGGRIVTILGTAYPVGMTPAGFRDKPAMAHGFALTFGVPRDFFERWMEQNRRNPIVENRMIFGFEKIEDVRAKARNYATLQSGLEPINPEGDPRMPRPLTAGITSVHPADEMGGRQRQPVAAE